MAASSSSHPNLIQIPRSQIPAHYINHHHHLNPSPTTFVQAHTSTFKQVVQMLTGSPDTAKHASAKDPPPPSTRTNNTNFPIPPIRNKKSQNNQQQSFKLYERRNSSFKHCSLMINPAAVGGGRGFVSSSSSPSSAEILSPSLLDFPKLTLLSPGHSSAGNCSGSSSSAAEEEERAIAEKGFYLHPSPLSTPRESEPQLLPLFPLTSPREAKSPPPPAAT
ncbi:VQ motif-containing protein 4 [Linum grandiflorum]